MLLLVIAIVGIALLFAVAVVVLLSFLETQVNQHSVYVQYTYQA